MDIESARIMPDGATVIVIDGSEMFVPEDNENRHRIALNEWLAAGNEMEVSPTRDWQLPDYQQAIREHMDLVANEKDYDSAVTIATYATSTIPKFKTEADCFIAWRDRLFVYANAEMAKFFSGQRQRPTPAEFISELEVIQWPPEEEPEDA